MSKMFIVALIYLSVPVFLILFCFFSVPFVILSSVALTIIILSFSNYKGKQDCTQPLLQTYAKYWPMLLISLIVCYLSFVQPFLSWDWQKHFAFFTLLTESVWPPLVELEGEIYFLRYYLAWYILPTLILKVFSAKLLTMVIVIYTAVGLFITLALSFHSLRTTCQFFTCPIIFLFFSGLDLIGAYFIGNFSVHHTEADWLQNWTKWGQISPTMFGITWFPHHAIGGWIGTAMFLHNYQLATKYSVLIIVVVALWSPFCAIGLLPIAVWTIIHGGYKNIFTPQNILGAPLISVPIIMYLKHDVIHIPFKFVWENHEFSFYSFILFCLFEFLIILMFLYWRRQDRGLIVCLSIFLAILCMFSFGTANDLLMRCSIPAICTMAVLMVKNLLGSRGMIKKILMAHFAIGAIPVAFAFAAAISPLVMGRVDRDINLKKFLYQATPPKGSGLLSYHHYYLANAKNMTTFFGSPILRGDLQRGHLQP